jgi:hypothetical protein
MATLAADVDGQEVAPASARLTLLPLVALVLGSMIGGGLFNLPSVMAKAPAPGAIVIGWLITGIGMLMLAFVYQSPATRKPDLNAAPWVSDRLRQRKLPILVGIALQVLAWLCSSTRTGWVLRLMWHCAFSLGVQHGGRCR